MNRAVGLLALCGLLLGCEPASIPPEAETETTASEQPAVASPTSEAELENLVRRAYQYVAMYNVTNKFAMAQGGWNTCRADTELKDHTLRDIARPNNDTLYTSCLLDLRSEPIVVNIPAFDSKYASLMVTGYDHYVNVPLSTGRGDFRAPQTMLFYSARTEGYDGEPVDGVDHVFEATGDFISAVFRVMPHAVEPDRFQRIVEQKQSIRAVPLSEFRGETPKPYEPPDTPPVGQTDLDVFANNLLEVMQFVFNHTTFDPDDEMDQAVLAAYAPLGVAPGRAFAPEAVAPLDGQRVRAVAQGVQQEWLGRLGDETVMRALQPRMFQPKGQTDFEAVLAVSIVGPIGLPQEEAIYPQVPTADGEPMNAMHDYVIRMSQDEMPPSEAFWSLTLYDLAEGFFIPNERKKYSVGENAGMQLDEDGGIEIYIAAEKPEGVPEDNWLPIERKDLALSPQLRLYDPDLEAFARWKPPVAEKL
jgi:hypothetical protein